ncbi:DNA-binding response regulator [Halopseudomonas laoshanensis]|uniref:DNA-binding response regulator n=1 Tax=Halopseudomonas laoshanensis TaxID=2268758 RepID=A0A7V7GUA3_9GAMM|nr:response regulator transcription factor [Halopseudomonas laoshanensis]KAA0695080.1 DNA-binding response regulator [Halopseudomonas laoshanensis]
MLQSPSRILIIEDDLTLSAQLCSLLKTQGYLTQTSHEGEAGLQMALNDRADLVLLDVKLPDLNGFALLRRLREHRQLPVIMLTACGAEEERIRGLRHGADDYLSKPFNLLELQLRIDAVLRRTRSPESQRLEQQWRLDVDGLTLDRRIGQASYGQRSLELTPIQFKLLWHLLTHRGETLSKPYLYRSVLEREFSRYDRSLDMHISRIRRRLTDMGMAADRLQTLHGRGYSFV